MKKRRNIGRFQNLFQAETISRHWKKFPEKPQNHDHPVFGNSFRDLPIWVKIIFQKISIWPLENNLTDLKRKILSMILSIS